MVKVALQTPWAYFVQGFNLRAMANIWLAMLLVWEAPEEHEQKDPSNKVHNFATVFYSNRSFCAIFQEGPTWSEIIIKPGLDKNYIQQGPAYSGRGPSSIPTEAGNRAGQTEQLWTQDTPKLQTRTFVGKTTPLSKNVRLLLGSEFEHITEVLSRFSPHLINGGHAHSKWSGTMKVERRCKYLTGLSDQQEM